MANVALDTPGERGGRGDLDLGEGAVRASAEGTLVLQIDRATHRLLHQIVGDKKDDKLRVGVGSVWVLSELDSDIWR